MTAKRWILGVGASLLAIAGHVAWSYLPRARPVTPRDGSPVAALLASQDFPAAVWVPYPHQNLAHLRQVAGAGPASLRAVARLAGLPAPALPTFGPLALPPSSEIAFARFRPSDYHPGPPRVAGDPGIPGVTRGRHLIEEGWTEG